VVFVVLVEPISKCGKPVLGRRLLVDLDLLDDLAPATAKTLVMHGGFEFHEFHQTPLVYMGTTAANQFVMLKFPRTSKFVLAALIFGGCMPIATVKQTRINCP
jgi:hypothetical protein